MFHIAFDSIYCHPLPSGHRFPMQKYELLPEQLLYEGTVESSFFFRPDKLSEERILRTHDEGYWAQLRDLTLDRKAQRKIGFPLSAQLVERERIICNGTTQNAAYALEEGVSFNIAGGTHHAYTNRGEGFCLMNDIAVGAHYLIDEKGFERILVVDLDVHQGNGTAEIFQSDKRVFTFSMHGDKNYPLQKESSDLDLALPDGISDQAYLKLLDYHLKDLIQRVEPQFIFFQAGVDILSTDKLGRLGLSIDGCRKRDHVVLKQCHLNQIPVAISMGGGYSEKLSEIIEAHANTYRTAAQLYL